MMDWPGAAKAGDYDSDTIFVAMGEDVEESKPNLVWTLCNLRARKICILHIYVPAQSIPFRAAMFLKGGNQDDRIRIYRQSERQKVQKVLEEYKLICEQSRVPAEILCAERDSIETGIIELISGHGVKKLVMGAKKAEYISRHAPGFCHFWFIQQGHLKCTWSGGATGGQKSQGLFDRPGTAKVLPNVSGITNDDIIYVAVGDDLEESTTNLVWTFHNVRTRRICILHIYVPAQNIPFRAAMFLKSVCKEDRLREYHKTERQRVQKVLKEYMHICEQAGVPAEISYAERESIEIGIIELISTYGVKKLVMGSKKAEYFIKHAPNFCHIWFIHKGCLTFTRGPMSDEINIEVNLLHQASSCNESGLSSSSKSICGTGGQKDPLSKRKDPEFIRVTSDDYGLKDRSNFPTEASIEATQGISDKEQNNGVNDWNSIRNRTSSVDSLFSSLLPSERKDELASFCLLNIGQSEIFDEGRDHSFPSIIIKRSTDQDIYDKLEQFSSEIEFFKLEAYQESIRSRIAEKEISAALHGEQGFRTMYEKEFEQRREFEESLARGEVETEKIRSHITEMLEKVQAVKERNASMKLHVKDSKKMMQELEEKAATASYLLHKFKNESDVLQVERDNACKLANELREQTAEERSDTLMSQLYLDISFSEVQEATRGFDLSMRLEQGDFARTYRGLLRNTQVCIKMLQPQASSKFQNKVNMFSRLRHPNLIMLIGACPEKFTLIFEYFPNGSLEDRLSCRNNTAPLPWQTRICIAAELCSVLMFLHSCSPKPIIYGNFNPSNVLLDANYTAKLSDIGIGRPRVNANEDSIAYIDPEFLVTGELTPRSNVYSFGITLLRLLTGGPAPGVETKVQNALNEGNLEDLLDPTAGDWPIGQAKQLVQLAMSCCELNPWRRSDLVSEVWRVLEPMAHLSQISAYPSDSGETRDVPASFLCPISQEVMQEPVIASDGFSYEADAIKAWFDGGHVTSPMTNLRLTNCNLVPNRALHSAIQAYGYNIPDEIRNFHAY